MSWLTNTSMAAGMQTAHAHTEALKAQLASVDHRGGGDGGDGGDGGPKRPRRRWFARWRRRRP